MRVVCTMKPQFRESSVQHTLGDWSAENGIHEIHPPKLLCDSGHQLYDILVRGQNQQKVHVPATLLQLCFRDIVHQHSLMAPTSEHTFSSWNERSNLYIGIGKQAYSGLPILKVPCAFGSWNFQSRGMGIGKPSLHVPCASVSGFKGKGFWALTNDGPRTRGKRSWSNMWSNIFCYLFVGPSAFEALTEEQLHECSCYRCFAVVCTLVWRLEQPENQVKKWPKTHKKRLENFISSLIISIFEYRKHPIYGESII